MSSARWDDDEQLLSALREALHDADPVPEHLVVAAQAAYSWRTIDEELNLAALVFDSELENAGAVRGAGDSGPRTLVFEGTDLSVEIEVGPEQIVGQLIPAQPGQITLTTATGGSTPVAADDVGCFLLSRPSGTGAVRLTCRATDGTFRTPWLTL